MPTRREEDEWSDAPHPREHKAASWALRLQEPMGTRGVGSAMWLFRAFSAGFLGCFSGIMRVFWVPTEVLP